MEEWALAVITIGVIIVAYLVWGGYRAYQVQKAKSLSVPKEGEDLLSSQETGNAKKEQ